MINLNEEVKSSAKRILDIIYEMYLEDLKSGNVSKNNGMHYFGKILKKKNSKKNDELPNLFGY